MYTFGDLLENHLRARGFPATASPESFAYQNQSTLYDVLWWLLNQARQHPSFAQQEIDLEFLEFYSFALSRMPSSMAQLCQDLWVLWELGQKRDGYFVEFGATDGLLCSNTYLLEKAYGWKGILAEPNPTWHAGLARNRGCAISHKCVYVESGRQLAFKCCGIAELSTIAEIDAEDFFEKERQDHTQILVDTITLTDLLLENGAPPIIEYLSIDTEGSELDILQAHDFSRYSFRLITVEHNGTPRRSQIGELLKSKGYARVFTGYTLFDDWYVNTDLTRRGL